MTFFDTIIPIGENCNITFLLQALHIKKETGLFEWFLTQNLQAITHVLRHVANKTLPRIEQHGGNIHVGTPDMFSSHYLASEFMSIYERRAERLYKIIQQTPRILFIRFEINSTTSTTMADIDEFLDVIHMINPDTRQMKLLWISPNKHIMDHPFVIYKYCPYDTGSADTYKNILSPTSQLFIKCLHDVGYDRTRTTIDKFTDKSEI